jgi:hypothetical protein
MSAILPADRANATPASADSSGWDRAGFSKLFGATA